MVQTFTASGYVSRMYCSISRMARPCRVNSPSFCRDTTGRGIFYETGTPGPLPTLYLCSHGPRPRNGERSTHPSPHTLFTNPSQQASTPASCRTSSGENLGKT